MARQKKAVVFQRKDGRFGFHSVAGNGEITSASQSYTRRWSAHRAIENLWPGIKVEDIYES